MRLLKLLLVMLVCAAMPAAAGPLEDATAAYLKGDYATALRLWRPLAEQGDASAQTRLGNSYYDGQGVSQDYAAALTWYRKAADQGYAIAQHNLGAMYEGGQGVSQDYAAALTWYRKAADQGYAQDQNNLGRMYAYGKGVPQDYVQAHKWFNLAASRAQEGDEWAAQRRNEVAAKMTPAQIAEAQKLAREWKPK